MLQEGLYIPHMAISPERSGLSRIPGGQFSSLVFVIEADFGQV
jgi:hypothetical protein